MLITKKYNTIIVKSILLEKLIFWAEIEVKKIKNSCKTIY